MIPPYIERRIRQTPPSDSYIVAGSTPVVSFGNAQTARVATLGLNPSRVEFLDKRAQELTSAARRLATHASLGRTDLTTAPAESIAQVFDDCNTYFQRNPYRRWFDQLNPAIEACGASYGDGSACHLDLVQWATDPTWGKLKPNLKKQLVAEDAPFLLEQLRSKRLQILLVNGWGVLQELSQAVDCQLQEVERLPKTRMYVGKIDARVRVIGWSVNLQSSFGVSNDLRQELAQRVGELADV